MTNQLNMAIIGYGAIAGHVLKAVTANPAITVTAIIAREPSIAKAQKFAQDICPDSNCSIVTSIQELPDNTMLVVDCAGHEGLKAHGANALEAGYNVMTVSTGALSDPEVQQNLIDAAETGNARLTLLSGAVGGIDILCAGNTGEIRSVTYTGRKAPKGWLGSPAEQQCDLLSLAEPFVHFDGSARDAAANYPKNANVAATIALAGIGMDETRVQLIADPDATKNIHEVFAEGDFGTFELKVQGETLPDNPKSSALAAMSIVQALEQLVKPVGF